MDPTTETGPPGIDSNSKKLRLLEEYPSPFSLAQESNKVIASNNHLTFAELYKHLGFDQATSVFDRLQLVLPHLEQLSNINKIRLIRAGAIYNLISGADIEQPADTVVESSIQYIMTDSGIRGMVKSQVKSIEKGFTPESAREQDLQFVRTYGGSALERRLLDGKITRDQAVSISSVFESDSNKLSTLERTQIINYFTNGSAIGDMHFRGSLTADQARNLILNIKLRTYALHNVLDVSFVKSDSKDHIPFSSFEGILDKIAQEFEACKSFDSLKKLGEELKSGESIPLEINSLATVLEITSDHPEIKAVSFDLYNTLVEWSSDQIERRGRMDNLSAGALRTKFGLSLTQSRFNQAAEKAWSRRHTDYQVNGQEVNIEETMSWVADDLLKDTRVTGRRDFSALRNQIVDELTQTWYRVELETASEMPGAKDVLRKLKARGLKLCITSNASWSPAHVSRVLKKFGLEEYLDAVSLSSEAGVMKHPERTDFYRASWEKLGVRPAEVLHIGDDDDADRKGATNAGGVGIYLNNPKAFITVERDSRYKTNREDYSQKALRHHELALNRDALAYVESMMEMKNIPIEERDRVRQMAREIYQKSRDVIGPAHLVISERILTKLRNKTMDLALCMARDGLPLAITTKLLLYLEPTRFEGVKPDQVRYAYTSRKFVDRAKTDPDFREKFVKYLKGVGVDRANNILITDLFSSGSASTHQGIVELLAGKHVEGLYLDAFPRPDIANREGLLRPLTRDPTAGVTAGNMLFLIEGLYNGIFESTRDFRSHGDRLILPINGRQEPTADALDRGLSRESVLLLHQIAIRGLVDSVHKLHRRRLLGAADKPEKLVMDIYNKFTSEDPTPIWKDIWRSIPWKDHATGWRRQIDIATDIANHENPNLRDASYLKKVA